MNLLEINHCVIQLLCLHVRHGVLARVSSSLSKTRAAALYHHDKNASVPVRYSYTSLIPHSTKSLGS